MLERKSPDTHVRPGAAITRLAALAAATALFLTTISARAEDPVAQLIKRASDKNAAFMRGDMVRWAELAHIAPDFTLMQPFGGPASQGFDASPTRMRELSRYFRNGTTALDVTQTYASEELAVLVMIERQRGQVGGLPEQDWSLRVTEVYRKRESEWQLVHRHADPLVRPITLEEAAALARGSP